MRQKVIRIGVIVVDLFAAVTAIVGAFGLVIGFWGIPLSVLQGSPFTDFTYPALLLGLVVGGSALTAAAIAVLGPHRIETTATAAAGCVMIGWITIELAMIGMSTWVQPFYLIVGLAMIGLAGALQVTKLAATIR